MMYDPSATRSSIEHNPSSETNSSLAIAIFLMFYGSLRFHNLLKPTGYVMHQQFNIQQLNALPTLYLCVLYLSQNKQRLVLLTS